MKILSIVVLFSALCFGQNATPSAAPLTLTLTGPASIVAGAAANLTVTLTGSAGLNISALEWTAQLPAGIGTSSPSASDAMTGYGKALDCNGAALCILAGFAANVPSDSPILADGVVAVVPVTVPIGFTGPLTVALGTLFAADTTGAPIPIASGPALGIPVLPSPCSATGVGPITIADGMAVVSYILGAAPTCTLPAGCTLPNLVRVLAAASGQACTIPLPGAAQ